MIEISRPCTKIGVHIDVQEGASGASADAPVVGLEMVSDLKFERERDTDRGRGREIHGFNYSSLSENSFK